jgi:hypothetical protein
LLNSPQPSSRLSLSPQKFTKNLENTQRPKRKKSTIDLLEKQIEALNKIAAEFGALSRSGPTVGNPSWRVLLDFIASGQLKITHPGRDRRPERRAKKRKPFRAYAKYPAKWWKPNFAGLMNVQEAVAASGYTIEQLIAGGMRVGGVGDTLLAPPLVGFDKWLEGDDDDSEYDDRPTANSGKGEESQTPEASEKPDENSSDLVPPWMTSDDEDCRDTGQNSQSGGREVLTDFDRLLRDAPDE